VTGPAPRLGAWPLALLVFCCGIGPLPFGLVGFAVSSAGRSVVGWAAIGLLLGPFFAWWGSRVAAPVMGEGVFGSLWAAAGALFFLVGAGLSLHLWLEVLRVSEYPNTPSWAIALVTLSAVAYVVRMGPENLARLATPLAAILALTVGGVLVLAWGLGRSGHLVGGLHLLTAGGGLPAAWPLLVFASHGSALSPVFLRYTNPGLYRRPLMLAGSTAALLVAAAFVLPIVTWDIVPALRTEFPLLHAITPVSTIFFPVHRLALLAFIPLQLSVIVQLGAYATAALQLAGRPIFPLASAPAILLACAAIAVMAVWPAPSFTVARLAALWSLAGLALLAALPLAQGRRAAAPVSA
jgi:hypothetical protein